MAAPSPQSFSTICPRCHARFQAPLEMAGRKGRCPKCGEVFVMSTPMPPPFRLPPQPTVAPSPPAAPVPVTCRVCQTLMYARPEQIGKRLKCPDCGAATVVKPPQPVPAKPVPAALEGEQYEVWGVDEAPSVAEMLAAQPKYIAVVCRTCQTLMYGTEQQVGTELKCPDCGTANVVPALPVIRAAAIEPEEYELEIDDSRDPGERPPVVVAPRRPLLYEEERDAELTAQAARQARGNWRGPQYDERGRPILPRWPLLTRILPFLISRGVPVRWMVFSTAVSAAAGIMFYGLTMSSTGGFGAIGGMSFFVMGLILLVICFAAISAAVFTIITESSEGVDQIGNWPRPLLTEWLGEMFYMLVAVIISPFPGWLIGRVLTDDLSLRSLLFVVSAAVCLPVILLSQLDIGSAFAVASPRVISSLLRLPGTWLVFYFEIAALVALCVGVALVANENPAARLLLVPTWVGAVLLAARILGRLGWKLAETLPPKAEAEAVQGDVKL